MSSFYGVLLYANSFMQLGINLLHYKYVALIRNKHTLISYKSSVLCIQI